MVWSADVNGKAGSIIVAGGKLLMVSSDGDLALIQPKPGKYQELGRKSISKDQIRALPALSNGTLVVRDLKGKVTAWSLATIKD